MVLNLERWKARLAKLPEEVKAAAAAQLEANAHDMVGYLQAAAPTQSDIAPNRRGSEKARKEAGDFENLREHIHAEPAENRELTWVVLCDPVDEKGHGYAQHVEYGHKTPDGGHVQARPFFWPTYRAFKKQNRRRLLDATRRAAKKAFTA